MAPTCILAAREPVLLRSLKRALDAEIEVVAMVDNTVSLESSIASLEPDLLVVDLDLLGVDAARILELLSGRRELPPLIGLSEDDPAEVDAQRLGLAAVVARPLAGRELLPAVREVLSRAKTQNGGIR